MHWKIVENRIIDVSAYTLNILDGKFIVTKRQILDYHDNLRCDDTY